jgi:RNA polymerase sigma factor (sigma-70 family)
MALDRDQVPSNTIGAAGALADASRDHDHDLESVRAILRGSTEAWSAFLVRYSGLIHAVIRRHVRIGDDDDHRTIYVDVIEALYRHKLATYEGRAALSTWLTIVTRTAVLDFLRRRFGRRRPPKGLQGLDAVEQSLFRMFYIEGRGVPELLAWLDQHGKRWTTVRVIETLRRIESLIDRRWRLRLAYDAHARSTGVVSGRLLEYLDHVREERQDAAAGPEYELMEREARITLERVKVLIAGLPPAEREIVALRFEHGHSARTIADELGIARPREVYTVLERVIRTLRRQFLRHEFP